MPVSTDAVQARVALVEEHIRCQNRHDLEAVMATFGTELYTKYVIVVDDDVDIFNMNDVMWAIATRVRAEKDILLIPGCKGAIIDPTSDPQTFTLTKMGIDATRPADKDFAERLVISDEQRARARALLESAGVKL